MTTSNAIIAYLFESLFPHDTLWYFNISLPLLQKMVFFSLFHYASNINIIIVFIIIFIIFIYKYINIQLIS